MSNPEGPEREWRHPTLTLVMFFTGVILLLPGICSLLFIRRGWGDLLDGNRILWWAISAGGLWLIWKSFRPR